MQHRRIKEVIPMPTCKECKQFFPLEEDPDKGDCVSRVVDPRQAYYKAKPVDVHEEAGDCPNFQRKP
jgi:benzylsuccinate synthase